MKFLILEEVLTGKPRRKLVKPVLLPVMMSSSSMKQSDGTVTVEAISEFQKFLSKSAKELVFVSHRPKRPETLFSST